MRLIGFVLKCLLLAMTAVQAIDLAPLSITQGPQLAITMSRPAILSFDSALRPRAFGCNPGYKVCEDGCIPNSAVCCLYGGYCYSGNHCYDSTDATKGICCVDPQCFSSYMSNGVLTIFTKTQYNIFTA